jgi:hypothetical protein
MMFIVFKITASFRTTLEGNADVLSG